MDVVREILEFLQKKVLAKDSGISADIKQIGKCSHNKRIAFVDGGNAEIMKAPNFSLQFVRVCAVLFQGNARSKIVKNEFYVLAHASGCGDLRYKAEVFPANDALAKALEFDALDCTIRNGTEKADISRIGSIARRFAELRLAEQVLADADVIVLDGSLKCLVTNEKMLMQSLCNAGAAKGAIICALSKTSDALTSNGSSIVGQIGSMLKSEGYVEQDDVFFAKLNRKSKYVFSFEIYAGQNVSGVLGMLSQNACDASFPGYPYGLILADKFARVSTDEKSYLLMLFQARAGKQWAVIENHINATNAHGMLDR